MRNFNEVYEKLYTEKNEKKLAITAVCFIICQ